MVVKNHGDQAHGEDQARRNSPSQLEPHRVKSDLFAEPPALDISAVEIVRQDGQQRAKKKLKHGRAPFALPERALLALLLRYHLARLHSPSRAGLSFRGF